MQGFFNLTKKKPIKTKSTTSRTKGVKEALEPCEACGLYKGCLSPKMKYSGKGNLEVLIIAEAPGEKEDQKGTQLIGQAG